MTDDEKFAHKSKWLAMYLLAFCIGYALAWVIL